MPHDIGNFMAAAREAAGAAGSLIRDRWLEPGDIAYKGSIDLVTSVDREAERRIVDMLRRKFKDHSILAEEETEILGGNHYRWIIDPLDGTTNFAHGYPQCAVSIALEYRDEIILGLVYDPLRNERFEAASGEGATLNGDSIHVSRGVKELDKALLATGFPYDGREHADFYLSFFKAFMVRSQGIRRAGSAALDLCYVGCGRVDGYWELKLRPWDVAAAALIVTEAGGKVSDFSGKKFSTRGTETLASNGAIHDEMLAVMRALRTQRTEDGA